MNDTPIAQLLEQDDVRSWVEMAEKTYPGFRTDLVFLGGPQERRMMKTHGKAVRRVLLTYARLRDWAVNTPCELLENWVRSNIAATNVEQALRVETKPATILDEGNVTGWLANANAVNDEFCEQVRFAILLGSASTSRTKARMQALQTAYTNVARRLGNECEKIAGFLGLETAGGAESETGTGNSPARSDKPQGLRVRRMNKPYVLVPSRGPRRRTAQVPKAPTADPGLTREMNRAGVERGHKREHARLFAQVMKLRSR